MKEGFYNLYTKEEETPVLVHGYNCSDMKGAFVFGFNTHDGGGLLPLSDLKTDSHVVAVSFCDEKTDLDSHKEEIAARVHDSWWREKENQGFHPPCECLSESAKDARDEDLRSFGLHEFPKFHKFCDKCHSDMYPYPELPENVKDYDRVTVSTVLAAISDLNE